MWAHPDIINDPQWATRGKESKGKAKMTSCNMISTSLKEDDAETSSLTDSEEEEFTLAAERDSPVEAGTRSGKDYLRRYDEAVESSSKTIEEPVKLPSEKEKAKSKELRYNKALRRDDIAKPSSPFRFDVLAQLANIPARITLYKLLKLSKATREALREALAESEAFMMQFPDLEEEEGEQCSTCHQTAKKSSIITFTEDDMQIKYKHDRPLY